MLLGSGQRKCCLGLELGRSRLFSVCMVLVAFLNQRSFEAFSIRVFSEMAIGLATLWFISPIMAILMVVTDSLWRMKIKSIWGHTKTERLKGLKAGSC